MFFSPINFDAYLLYTEWNLQVKLKECKWIVMSNPSLPVVWTRSLSTWRACQTFTFTSGALGTHWMLRKHPLTFLSFERQIKEDIAALRWLQCQGGKWQVNLVSYIIAQSSTQMVSNETDLIHSDLLDPALLQHLIQYFLIRCHCALKGHNIWTHFICKTGQTVGGRLPESGTTESANYNYNTRDGPQYTAIETRSQQCCKWLVLVHASPPHRFPPLLSHPLLSSFLLFHFLYSSLLLFFNFDNFFVF